jgi:hypothetical protein
MSTGAVGAEGLNYRALVEARGTLKARAAAAYGQIRMPDEEGYAGIVYQACVAAEHAVFEALNVLSTFGDDPEALRVVHMREWEDAVDPEAAERERVACEAGAGI